MSQRKKAKSKKGLKKSITRIWKALVHEKEKHKIASALIGKLKQENRILRGGIAELTRQLDIEYNKVKDLQEIQSIKMDAAADLIERIHST